MIADRIALNRDGTLMQAVVELRGLLEGRHAMLNINDEEGKDHE
jgi:hypothetical protein